MMGSNRRAQVTEQITGAVKQAGAGLVGAIILAAVALLVAGIALLRTVAPRA